jgi:acyl-coenzyme A synthetase/AMP-(fatty) acid ligase
VEIEQALLAQKRFANVYVRLCGVCDNQFLAAYVQLCPPLSFSQELKGQVIEELRHSLPDYMIPQRLLAVEEVP